MSITAVVNQKGGVGKTTVALGLTAALAARGARVLVVDLDPQANASTGLGVWNAERAIDAVLSEDRAGAAAAAVVQAGWPDGSVPVMPSVVPSSPNLAQVEHQLHSDVIGAQDRLSTALGGVADDFDEVVIDCPPSLGLLTVNALFAADRVVVVTEPAAWSSDGVEQILRNVTRIAERRGGSPELAGIVVNRLGRTRDAGYWAGELASNHPELVLGTAIRMRAALAESAAQSVPVAALSRSGAAEAASEFEALTAEVFGPVTDPADTVGPAETADPADTVGPEEAADPADTVGGADAAEVDGDASVVIDLSADLTPVGAPAVGVRPFGPGTN
mgnify:CR=1 FL=1